MVKKNQNNQVPAQQSRSFVRQLSFLNLSFEDELLLLGHMREWVMSELLLRLANILTREQLLECIRISEISGGDDDALWQYVANVVPNIDDIFADVIASVRSNIFEQKNLITQSV